MVGLAKIPFVITLLFICLGSRVKSDASDHQYSAGDAVPLYANKIGSYFNSWETYAYYDLPFCSPDNVTQKKPSLGEMLSGDRLVSTPYKLEFLVNKSSELSCKKRLKKTDVSQFRSAIKKSYYLEMYCDDLPIWAFIGWAEFDMYKRKYFLYTHLNFNVLYNKDRIIGFLVEALEHYSADLTEDKEVDVEFTYSVRWSETQETFDKRREVYIDSYILPPRTTVHRHSIAKSCVTIIILVICLLKFYVQVLRKDISRYAHDVEDVEVADNQQETGWKNIHGDVFRFPKHKSLFAAALGSGTQLLILMAAIIILGVIGVFQPYVRGVFFNAVVINYAITSVVSGYISVSFYRQLEGTHWIKNVVLAGGLFFWPLFITFAFLNTSATVYRVTASLPLAAIVILALLWTFLASPLLLLGAIFGRNGKAEFKAPCRTAKCPREVPKLRWYRSVLPQMALAGILPFSVISAQLYYIFDSVWGYKVYALYSILAIVFFLLLIITALVSVALTYFQLAAEDHRWWWRCITSWHFCLQFLPVFLLYCMLAVFSIEFPRLENDFFHRSFLCGGSAGLFIYGYCIYYYFWRSNMNGFMQSSFFFGYMACVCYGVFLALGTVGFHASLLFIRYLYASIKCE